MILLAIVFFFAIAMWFVPELAYFGTVIKAVVTAAVILLGLLYVAYRRSRLN